MSHPAGASARRSRLASKLLHSCQLTQSLGSTATKASFTDKVKPVCLPATFSDALQPLTDSMMFPKQTALAAVVAVPDSESQLATHNKAVNAVSHTQAQSILLTGIGSNAKRSESMPNSLHHQTWSDKSMHTANIVGYTAVLNDSGLQDSALADVASAGFVSVQEAAVSASDAVQAQAPGCVAHHQSIAISAASVIATLNSAASGKACSAPFPEIEAAAYSWVCPAATVSPNVQHSASKQPLAPPHDAVPRESLATAQDSAPLSTLPDLALTEALAPPQHSAPTGKTLATSTDSALRAPEQHLAPTEKSVVTSTDSKPKSSPAESKEASPAEPDVPPENSALAEQLAFIDSPPLKAPIVASLPAVPNKSCSQAAASVLLTADLQSPIPPVQASAITQVHLAGMQTSAAAPSSGEAANTGGKHQRSVSCPA